jgi:hypothetical protein
VGDGYWIDPERAGLDVAGQREEALRWARRHEQQEGLKLHDEVGAADVLDEQGREMPAPYVAGHSAVRYASRVVVRVGAEWRPLVLENDVGVALARDGHQAGSGGTVVVVNEVGEILREEGERWWEGENGGVVGLNEEAGQD